MSRNEKLKNSGKPRLFEPAGAYRDTVGSVSREVSLKILEDTSNSN